MSSNTNTHSAVFPLIHGKKNSDGLSKPLACDGNGNLNSVVVNSVNIAPANTLNADHTSHSQSIAVGLRGFTDPANHDTTGKFVKASADGRLECMILGANDINGNTPRHLTIDGNGRTLVVPYEHPNSHRTLHLSSIKDNTAIVRDIQNVTTDYNGSNLSGSIGTGISSASCDVSSHRHIHLLIDGSGGGSSLTLEGSHSNTNTSYHHIEDLPPQVGISGTFFKTKIVNAVYPHYRITNNSGAPITFTTFRFTKLNL